MKNEILSLLPPGHPWGQLLIHLDTVDSTNSYAKQLAQQGAPDGTVLIADHQTGGRGRMGRSFSSPAGLGLYFSLILRPECPPEQLMHLTCAVGLAASDAVYQASGLLPGIKWTNDLVVGKHKLGGILTELSIDAATKLVEYAIIGIGINCHQARSDFPQPLQHIATSLALCSHRTSRAVLAAALMQTLPDMRSSLLTQKDSIMRRFSERCVTIGQDVCVCRGETVRHAHALGVDADGALLVRYEDGTHGAVASGEVSIRGMYGYL